MSMIQGTYKNYKNEDLEKFFIAVGVPFFVRKMLNITAPVIAFYIEGDTMTIKITSWSLSQVNTFKFGEEYIEKMPAGNIKCVTTKINDNELITNCVMESDGVKSSRHYLFNEEEVIETLTHEKATGVSKRYYQRVK